MDELSVSHGIINGIEVDDGNNFRHLCSTNDGSSGSPVLLSKNNKIVGIHKSSNKTFNYNNGVFLNNAINDFIKQLDDYDGTDFAEYMNVLPYIEYGMFQSAIKLIKTINIKGLETVYVPFRIKKESFTTNFIYFMI